MSDLSEWNRVANCNLCDLCAVCLSLSISCFSCSSCLVSSLLLLLLLLWFFSRRKSKRTSYSSLGGSDRRRLSLLSSCISHHHQPHPVLSSARSFFLYLLFQVPLKENAFPLLSKEPHSLSLPPPPSKSAEGENPVKGETGLENRGKIRGKFGKEDEVMLVFPSNDMRNKHESASHDWVNHHDDLSLLLLLLNPRQHLSFPVCLSLSLAWLAWYIHLSLHEAWGESGVRSVWQLEAKPDPLLSCILCFFRFLSLSLSLLQNNCLFFPPKQHTTDALLCRPRLG